MRKTVLVILYFLGISLFASQPLRIGVITDTHYLSEQLMDTGDAVTNYINASGKNISAVPAVLDYVFNDFATGKPLDILLVCGDITKDGEKQSHIDFVSKLKRMQDRGTRVFVIPGNHDINMPNAVEYKGNKSQAVANVSPSEFVDIYGECGYDDALRRDKSSLSYVAALDAQTWLLAIDAARYNEYKTHSLSSGKISPQTEKWIVDVLDEAKAKNIRVLGMMHWGLVEHIMYQSTFFGQYLVDDHERLASLFADKGMKAIFTGHFHANDITAFTSKKGNTIYDIETGTLAAYPFAYRYMDYYPTKVNITTSNVESLPQFPQLMETDKKRMLQLSERQALTKLKSMGYELPDALATKMAQMISQLFILHVKGDEVMSVELKRSIDQMKVLTDSSMDVDDLQLDFPPADNNVTITF